MRAPWLLAVALGAASSLERGRLDKALKFLQTGLRADPDAAALQRQYEGLKLLQKLVRDADEQLLLALDELFQEGTPHRVTS